MTENPVVFCIVNQKGGVGKTTSAVNIAASFAVSERRTLLVDIDPQGNASSAFGISRPRPQIYDGLVRRESIETITYDTELEHLKIIPAGPDLVGAEVELVSAPRRAHRLADLLKEAAGEYEFVLIDCPPSLGLLTLNALVAATRLIVPLQAEYYALEGLAHLMSTVERVQRTINPRLDLEGILLTMFDARNNLGHQVAAEVRGHFGAKVFGAAIPRNVRLSEAPSFGKPALLYDAKSAGARSYLEVAAEILLRYPVPDARHPESLDASIDANRDASSASLTPSPTPRDPPPPISRPPPSGPFSTS